MNIPFVDLKAQQSRIRDNIRERIDAVLEHGKYILGPEVGEFEERLAAFCGAKYALGVSSGTDALLMALMAGDIGPGDAVFMPTFTFTATAEVCLMVGATPVFVDVDEATFNIDPASLNRAVAAVAEAGRLRPSAVIAVDLFGLPADYEAIGKIAKSSGLNVIADAAQSFGGARNNVSVGNLAAVTATSFFPAKPLGGYGDGGALLTDDADLLEIFRSIRAHGKGSGKYDIVRVGLNARLDTLQAAILLAKLDIFGDELEARERVAKSYDERLKGHVTLPLRQDGYQSAWAQYTIQVYNRDEVAARLKAAGIPTAVYYPLPMHRQPAYAEHWNGEELANSERLAGRVLSLPMHPYLADEVVDNITEAIKTAISG